MKNTQKKGLPWLFRIGILLMVVNLLLTGFYLAKYVVQDSYVAPISAKSFYFESDLLNGDTYTLQPGVTEFSFSLMNYTDILRISEVDFKYTITVNGVTGSAKNFKTDGTPKVITETISDLAPNTTYTISVVATSPYTTQPMTATVKTQAVNADVSYTVEDGSNNPVCYLNIFVGDYTGQIRVTTPSGVTLSPDETVITSVTANTSYRYTYFKNDHTQNYKNSAAFDVEKVNP